MRPVATMLDHADLQQWMGLMKIRRAKSSQTPTLDIVTSEVESFPK